jgi:hypothetical protein
LAFEWQQDWFMENIKKSQLSWPVGLILGEEHVDLPWTFAQNQWLLSWDFRRKYCRNTSMTDVLGTNSNIQGGFFGMVTLW